MFNFLFTKTPLAFLVQSFWRDEAFSYVLAKKNLLEIAYFSAKDFNPPLYYFLLHFWMKLFGTSEIAIRSLSVIFYWATVYVGFLFLSDVLKMKLKKAFFYTFFIAINPLLIYYAFEARMYSMFAFLAALSFYALYKKNTFLYFLSTILGLYTHYFMILVLIAQYLISKFKQKIILLSYLPWLIFVLLNKGLSIQSFWVKNSGIKSLVNFVGQIYTGYEAGFGFYKNSVFYLSLIILIIVTIGHLKYRKNNQFRFFFIWGVCLPFLIALISFIKPIFLPRYLIFSTLGLILLLFFILEKLPRLPRYLIILLLLVATLNYNKLQIKERRKSGLKKTVMEIKYLMKKNDTLYVTNELDYFTVQYYIGEYQNKVYIWGKTYEEIPQYVGKALITKDKVTGSLPLYPNKAFILYPDGKYSIQAMY